MARTHWRLGQYLLCQGIESEYGDSIDDLSADHRCLHTIHTGDPGQRGDVGVETEVNSERIEGGIGFPGVKESAIVQQKLGDGRVLDRIAPHWHLQSTDNPQADPNDYSGEYQKGYHWQKV